MNVIIELSQGKGALIDKSSLRGVSKYKWRMVQGYPMASIDGVLISLGRFILDETDPSVKVYYKDSDPCNCTRRNLTRIWAEVRANETMDVIISRAESEVERMRVCGEIMQGKGQDIAAETYFTRARKMKRMLELGTKSEVLDYLDILSRVRSKREMR